MNRNQKSSALTILFAVGLLCGIGLIMVLSSSSVNLLIKDSDPYYYVKRQGMFLVLSTIGMFAAAIVPLSFIKKHIWKIYGLVVCALVVVLFTNSVNGASSWINIRSYGVQPAEYSKVLIIVVFALLYEKRATGRNFLVSMIFLGIIAGLVIIQPDIGTASLIVATAIGMMLITELPFWYPGVLVGLGIAGIKIISMKKAYIIKRMTIFLDPFSDPQGSGYQLIQSLYAIADGKWFGKGLGNSILKHGFLPELHTDFIFSIFVEEFGFIGVVSVVLLFAVLLFKVFDIAYNSETRFGFFIAAGVGIMIGIEAFLNIGVTLSILPVTGVTLPFISYGGSSLLTKMIGVGLVLNVNRNKGN